MSKDNEKSKESPATNSLRHEPTEGLYGWITHTELASADPDATRAWCASVLGWSFKPSSPTPNGDYHLFTYSDQSGGGIRRNNPPEVPGTIPYGRWRTVRRRCCPRRS